MAETTNAPARAGRGALEISRSGDDREHSASPRRSPASRPWLSWRADLAEVRAAFDRGALTGWPATFAASILAQSRRPRWAPSERQRARLRRLARDLTDARAVLVEIEDGRDAA